MRLGKKKRSAAVGTCFFNEARAANLVQHPAIVRVFDYGTTSTGTAYLAMEFLEGPTLSKILKERGQYRDVMELGRDSMEIFRAAWDAGELHLDEAYKAALPEFHARKALLGPGDLPGAFSKLYG